MIYKPCVDCKDRVPGCHGKCEHYAIYKEYNEKIKNAKALEGMYYAYQAVAVERMSSR
ncbi:hypothetical protein AALA22_15385 [Anaerovoracaceae bacterium 41-7]